MSSGLPRRLRRNLSAGVGLVLLVAALSAASGLSRTQEPAASRLPSVPSPVFLVDSQYDDLRTRLLRLDHGTGNLTLVADLGVAWTPILGLAAADATTLYASGTDSSPSRHCAGEGSCVLLRVTLPGPIVSPIGPVRHDGVIVQAITGLTFGSDGRLYAISQETDGLYVIDPATAAATLLGTVNLDLHGGDIVFDGQNRLWVWTNLQAAAGLYEILPDFTQASAFALFPSRVLNGLTAPRHDTVLAGAHAPGDLQFNLDTGTGADLPRMPLFLDGVRFDFKRGDLASPWCSDAAACDDGDPCTEDTCAPGGCRSTARGAKGMQMARQAAPSDCNS